MLERLQPVQKREAGVTADVLLSLIDRMKGDAPQVQRGIQILPIRIFECEASAYNAQGRIALREGTEESAKMAMVYFEKELKVCESIGLDNGIATANGNIAYAKSKYEGGRSNEEVLQTSREVYELYVSKYGEGNQFSLDAGRQYAIALQNSNRGDEARELLTELLASSKQLLGPHHITTKEVEHALIGVNVSLYKGGWNIEKGLEASKELYKLLISDYGDGNENTILAGKIYAINLQKASRGDESRKLLTKLLARSKQVLSPHHNTTKEVASALKWNRGIAFISRIFIDFILIGVLVVVCQLAKKMRFVTLDRWVLEVSIYLLFGF
jgi:hypothetical protein